DPKPFLRRDHPIKGDSQIASKRPQNCLKIRVGRGHGRSTSFAQVTNSTIYGYSLRRLEEGVVTGAFERVREGRIWINSPCAYASLGYGQPGTQLFRLKALALKTFNDLRFRPLAISLLATTDFTVVNQEDYGGEPLPIRRHEL